MTPFRPTDMPPLVARMIVLKCMPKGTRYSDYISFIAGYRRQVKRSLLWGQTWAWGQAADNAWRVVPDNVKHAVLAIAVRMFSRDA